MADKKVKTALGERLTKLIRRAPEKSYFDRLMTNPTTKEEKELAKTVKKLKPELVPLLQWHQIKAPKMMAAEALKHLREQTAGFKPKAKNLLGLMVKIATENGKKKLTLEQILQIEKFLAKNNFRIIVDFMEFFPLNIKMICEKNSINLTREAKEFTEMRIDNPEAIRQIRGPIASLYRRLFREMREKTQAPKQPTPPKKTTAKKPGKGVLFGRKRRK